MNKDAAQAVVEHIEEEFGEEAKLYEKYSGRCMYGKTTTGVVADSTGIVHRAMGALGFDFNVSEDNMGLSYIVY